MLDICFYANGGDPTELYIDLSQGIQRKCWSRGVIRTITTRSIIYSYDADAVISAVGMAKLQGFPPGIRPTESGTDFRSLVGEAVFLPNLATVIWAAYTEPTAPWHKDLVSPAAKRQRL